MLPTRAAANKSRDPNRLLGDRRSQTPDAEKTYPGSGLVPDASPGETFFFRFSRGLKDSRGG